MVPWTMIFKFKGRFKISSQQRNLTLIYSILMIFLVINDLFYIGLNRAAII